MNLKKLLLPLLSVSLLAAPVSTGYAAETNVAVAETEQGTLSPSSENSDSVFGGTSASDEPVTDEALQTLLNQIQGQLPADNGSWSVFVSDLINETEGSINDQTMQAASLIKLYIMGAIYENYDQIIGQYGKDSVDSNLHSMITVSDNDAANTLTTYLGGGNSSAGMQAVNSFCQEHGYNQTHMGRMLLASNDQDDNYTSVNDCGHFLIEVYKEEESSYAHASDMYALLKAQTRQNKIPAMLPDGVKTANKTGELDNVENDAGIIYDAANDLVIVFMSQNLSSAGNAQNTIASLSRTIYDYYNN
jgi:beta-lactamase class A